MKGIEPFPQPVLITRPLLPELEKLGKALGAIWERKQLTNNGPMAQELEKRLCEFLGAPYLSLFCNGTVALQIACKALELTGEVITTPFTFAATPHALVWSGLKPVFCDIEDETMNMDPAGIEELITPETSAIMPVHVFGYPCDVDGIGRIARKHKLKVVYDAAHAFGVELEGVPVGEYGDISMFSLHSTKIYHSIEGGALVFRHGALKEKADHIRNFGIAGEHTVTGPGTNGKLNELQGAVGLLVLDMVEEEIDRRRLLAGIYRRELENVCGIRLSKDMEGVRHNYSYFVIRINEKEFGMSCADLYAGLKEYNVFARRYFYPLCSSFSCYRELPSAAEGRLPVAGRTAEEVLALPMYGGLETETAERICDIIRHIGADGKK